VSESGAFRQVNGKILKFAPDGTGTVWHEGPFSFANGMALAPGGTHIYVAVSFLPGVEKITVLSDGSAGERSPGVHSARNRARRTGLWQPTATCLLPVTLLTAFTG
jgi:sugar lactone lactonase YvrE